MSEWWTEDIAEVCENFQMDISCLVDGELDEVAASRAMLHLESCDDCRAFFDGTRQCVQLHLDVADPDRLMARFSTLTGVDFELEAQGIELVHRLATVFYQLGKAYVLAGIDPDHTTRVFEKAVPLEPTQTRGRGFVDGVLMQGNGSAGGVDWRHARHMLNGQLKKIQGPLEKGRKLLEEAIQTDASHEEARFYMAFLHAHEGKTLLAFREYKSLFDTALCEENRGHAAMQLALLHGAEGDYRKALTYYRWLSMTGLARRDERFFVVHFNIGLFYAHLRDQERSLASFRRLIDEYPDRLSEIVTFFSESEPLQTAIADMPGFAEELMATCPELFGVSELHDTPPASSHDDE
jgi:hypothetical protein